MDLLPPAPQFTGYVWNPGDTNGAGVGFAQDFAGSAGATYSVWAGTNLLNRTDLGMAPESAPGQYQFTDFAAINWPACFYDLSVP